MANRAGRPACGECAKRTQAAAAKQVKEKADGEKAKETDLLRTRPAGR